MRKMQFVVVQDHLIKVNVSVFEGNSLTEAGV